MYSKSARYDGYRKCLADNQCNFVRLIGNEGHLRLSLIVKITCPHRKSSLEDLEALCERQLLLKFPVTLLLLILRFLQHDILFRGHLQNNQNPYQEKAKKVHQKLR